MGDVIVMCAECGLHAMVSGNLATITPKAKCKHRQNPANCPVLGPSSSVSWSARPHNARSSHRKAQNRASPGLSETRATGQLTYGRL